MKIRLCGIVSALSVLMMTGAQATPITYDVSFSLPALYPGGEPRGGQLAVNGTITTDGSSGVLSRSDIFDASLSVGSDQIVSPTIALSGSGLVAEGNKLVFNFDTGNADFDIYHDTIDTQEFVYFNSYVTPSGGYAGSISLLDYQTNLQIKGFEYVDGATVFTVATAAVSSVPLPPSAPMFGAALLAVGAAGYGMKRRKVVPAG